MNLFIAVTSEELGEVSGGFYTGLPMPPVVFPSSGIPCSCWGWGFPLPSAQQA
jgi:hypothetical protein